MRVFVLQCGCELEETIDSGVTVRALPAIPKRRDLAFLTDVAREVLPVDDAPTPDEIAKRKSVDYLGSPERAPQNPSESVRIVVLGTDAALAAVVTFLMRANLLWFEVAHVPTASSVASTNWSISGSSEFGLSLRDALSRDVHPVPVIRDDTGSAIVGYALLTEPDISGTASADGLIGEVYVDENLLFSGTANGIQIRPTPNEPGIVAAEVPAPAVQSKVSKDSENTTPTGVRRFFGALRRRGTETTSPRPLHKPLTGRAVQAGGPGFRYVRDGVQAKHPRDKVTIYRHLRDLQLVR